MKSPALKVAAVIRDMGKVVDEEGDMEKKGSWTRKGS